MRRARFSQPGQFFDFFGGICHVDRDVGTSPTRDINCLKNLNPVPR